MSSSTRATRSRYSSPANQKAAVAANALPDVSKSSVSRTDGPRTFLQRWLEPPVQSKASFEQAGLMRSGVLEGMAPLGSLPRPKRLEEAGINSLGHGGSGSGNGGGGGSGGGGVRKITIKTSAAKERERERKREGEAKGGANSAIYSGSGTGRNDGNDGSTIPQLGISALMTARKRAASPGEVVVGGVAGAAPSRSQPVKAPAKKKGNNAGDDDDDGEYAPSSSRRKKKPVRKSQRTRDADKLAAQGGGNEHEAAPAGQGTRSASSPAGLDHYPTPWALSTLYDEKSADPDFDSMVTDVLQQTADDDMLDKFSEHVGEKTKHAAQKKNATGDGDVYFLGPPPSEANGHFALRQQPSSGNNTSSRMYGDMVGDSNDGEDDEDDDMEEPEEPEELTVDDEQLRPAGRGTSGEETQVQSQMQTQGQAAGGDESERRPAKKAKTSHTTDVPSHTPLKATTSNATGTSHDNKQVTSIVEAEGEHTKTATETEPEATMAWTAPEGSSHKRRRCNSASSESSLSSAMSLPSPKVNDRVGTTTSALASSSSTGSAAGGNGGADGNFHLEQQQQKTRVKKSSKKPAKSQSKSQRADANDKLGLSLSPSPSSPTATATASATGIATAKVQVKAKDKAKAEAKAKANTKAKTTTSSQPVSPVSPTSCVLSSRGAHHRESMPGRLADSIKSKSRRSSKSSKAKSKSAKTADVAGGSDDLMLRTGNASAAAKVAPAPLLSSLSSLSSSPSSSSLRVAGGDDELDAIWNRRRAAQAHTNNFTASESSIRNGNQASTPAAGTRKGLRSATKAASPIATRRTTRSASKRPSEQVDGRLSPIPISLTADNVSTMGPRSRATTPTGQRASKRPKGLRVKSSPVKKSGGPAGGLPRLGHDSQPSFRAGTPRDSAADNDEFCSACGNAGDVLCCDGCPRSFHFECVNLSQSEDLPDEWYCAECVFLKFPSRVPVHKGVFAAALNILEKSIPRAFSLPKRIQNRFEGVKVGADGDYEEVASKTVKRRTGYDELPDLFKQRDENQPVLCHACQKPSGESRAIIPCSQCPFYWHLDCLDPPLAVPPLLKTWRCPTHIDDILADAPRLAPAHKFRRVKNSQPIAPIFTRGNRNNGYIEIDWRSEEQDPFKHAGWPDPLSFGRTYKVSAKGVILDFIEQLRRQGAGYGKRQNEQKWVPYPSPAPQPGETAAAGPLLGSTLGRQVDEIQASLNLIGLKQRPTDSIDQLTSALLAHADDNVLSMMALGNADNIALGRLAENDRQSLRAMLAQMDAMSGRIRRLLGDDKHVSSIPTPDPATSSTPPLLAETRRVRGGDATTATRAVASSAAADKRTRRPPMMSSSPIAPKKEELPPSMVGMDTLSGPTPPLTNDHAEGSMDID